jgi:hypothetical protein
MPRKYKYIIIFVNPLRQVGVPDEGGGTLVDPGMEKVHPSVVLQCGHLRYLTYRWTGARVAVAFEKRPWPLEPA